MKPILIVGALEKEINYILEKMENLSQKVMGKHKVYEGEINGYPVVLVKTEIGLINAASAVSVAIEKYDPIYVINEGTAGGITTEHHKKDIIIAKEVFNITSIRTPYKELGEGSNSLEWEFISYIDGGEDRKITYSADEELAQFFYGFKDKYKHGSVSFGIVGSGDAWNREKDKLKSLQDNHNVYCEEMEAVAVYKVAHDYNIPVVGIKIMSDNALLGEEYEPEVALYLQEYVYDVIVELINKIRE